MESYENVFDEEWVNLGLMFSNYDHDSNHFTELSSSEHDHALTLETSILWPSTNESNSSSSSIIDDQIVFYSSDHDLKSNFYNYFSQDSSNIHDIFQFCPSNNVPTDNVSDQCEDQCMMEGGSGNFLLLAQLFSGEQMEELLSIKQEAVVKKGKMENSVCQPVPVADLKRKCEIFELSNDMEISKNPTNKTRVSRDKKNKKNSPSKKNPMITSSDNSNEYDGEYSQQNNEKITNNSGRGNVQSSSSFSSEDDSNACQDLDGGAVNVTEKTRAGRGAATDPQSIYARKRRERINERLRILQTLVPNGTKVDFSTMLEEAVHYVKFLQLQIKLLSSDDRWMYAPIAYNGIDMGLYRNISPAL